MTSDQIPSASPSADAPSGAPRLGRDFLQGRRYWLAWGVALLALVLAIPGGRNSPGDVLAVLLLLPAGAVTWWGYRSRPISQGEAFFVGPFIYVLLDWIGRTLFVLLALPRMLRRSPVR